MNIKAGIRLVVIVNPDTEQLLYIEKIVLFIYLFLNLFDKEETVNQKDMADVYANIKTLQ